VTHSRVEGAGDVAQECLGTDSSVAGAGGVAIERTRTDGCVVVAVGVFIEGSGTNSGEVVAGRVEVEDSKANGQVRVGRVVIERLGLNAHVKAAGGVEGKSLRTNPHVVTAARIVKECTCTQGCIIDADGEAKKGVSALSRVVAGIASVGRRHNPESIPGRRKRKER